MSDICPGLVVGVRVLRSMRIRGNEGENASQRESVCVGVCVGESLCVCMCVRVRECVGVIVLWIVRM